ncbi:MAG: hypothetical protein JZD41_07655 [Thermoproteus sp.]|nr:hypothetical protein [Thermoproteus sp.]
MAVKELQRLEELIKMAREIKEMNCADLECALKKAFFVSKLARGLDKLFLKLAFVWASHDELKGTIDELMEIFIQNGLITRFRWEELKRLEIKYIRYVISPESKMVANVMKTPTVRELLLEIMDTIELNLVENKVKADRRHVGGNS